MQTTQRLLTLAFLSTLLFGSTLTISIGGQPLQHQHSLDTFEMGHQPKTLAILKDTAPALASTSKAVADGEPTPKLMLKDLMQAPSDVLLRMQTDEQLANSQPRLQVRGSKSSRLTAKFLVN
jgi:hypothetical protein